MPEIKNSFVKGKMNQDLDERLIPKGEFRFAQNLSISESEDSDTGAAEAFISKNIFNLTDKEIKEQQVKVIQDSKQTFRKTQIEDEGQDPANQPTGPEEDQQEGAYEPTGGKLGRPPEGTKYGTQDHVRGADPLGDDTRKRDYNNRDRTIRHNYKESLDLVTKSMDKNKKSSLLNENNLIDDESL